MIFGVPLQLSEEHLIAFRSHTVRLLSSRVTLAIVFALHDDHRSFPFDIAVLK